MQSDEQLMAAYQGGDTAAFRELFARYAPVLTRLFRMRRMSDADCGDLVQQTFLQVHRARHDFRSGAKLRPWVVTIGLNLMRQSFRSASRRPEDAGDVELAAGAGGLDRATELAVRQAIDALPDNQRDVVVLHWYQGMSFAEIGEVLGASTSAVKVRAHRAYKVLKQALRRATSQGVAA